ncbi:MAG: SGNH/GDSL hydrolase family protein [Rhodospirillales bacterium]|nr:SGNH/GDSL hydrolase family protein [Rhodospirillales bacterium]
MTLARARLATFLLFVASLVASLLVGEVGYRVWLAAKLRVLAQPIGDDPRPSFGVYNVPPWRFDRDAGFAYVPLLSYWTAYVAEGRFNGCTQPFVMTNADGNIGKTFGQYAEADIKVLVFADSFGTMHYDGDTWPNLLQRKLEDATGKRVNVLNLSRDSYGLLQMMDLAAREVPKWRPDYVIFAYITNDLARPRYWRIMKEVRGYWRFIQAMEPDESIEPGPDTTTNEVGLINPKITRDWCARMTALRAAGNADATRDDPVVRELVQQYNTIRRENARQIVDPADVDLWTLGRSYLYNRIVHGNTFHETGVAPRRVGYMSIDLMSFRDDARFVAAAERVRATGAKLLLIHFPVRPEVESNTQYIWRFAGWTKPGQGPALARSLEEVLGTETISLLSYMPLPIKDFSRYTASQDDWHPNAAGIEIYADAVLKVLRERGIATGAAPKPRRRRSRLVRARQRARLRGRAAAPPRQDDGHRRCSLTTTW